MVAHHALFDLYFLNRVMRAKFGFRLQNPVVDTVLICRTALIEPDPYGGRRGAKRLQPGHPGRAIQYLCAGKAYRLGRCHDHGPFAPVPFEGAGKMRMVDLEGFIAHCRHLVSPGIKTGL